MQPWRPWLRHSPAWPGQCHLPEARRRASFARRGKREIHTANIATTWHGAAGAGEATGTAASIMPVGAIRITCLQDAGPMPPRCRPAIGNTARARFRFVAGTGNS